MLLDTFTYLFIYHLNYNNSHIEHFETMLLDIFLHLFTLIFLLINQRQVTHVTWKRRASTVTSQRNGRPFYQPFYQPPRIFSFIYLH